jgi:cytochrome P450
LPELRLRPAPGVCADAGGEPARRGGPGRRAQLTIDELEADPHAALARLRAAEPVVWVDALGAWLVTSRELALQAMRDAETFTVDDPRFSTAQVVGQSMLTRDGAEHARHRDPFARPFRLDAVRAGFGAVVVGETDRLIGAFAHGRAELRRELAGPLAVAVVAHALGLERTDKVLGWYDAIVASVSGVAAGRPVTAAGAAAFAELSASLGPVLDDAPGLSRDEIVSNAAVIMFGGIETTEGMIANAIWHLLSNPDQLALVEADRSLLRNAVEESLRLEPAAAVIDRYATRDTVLGRVTIRLGEQVTLSLAAANRDPAVFPAPDRFDVRRQNAKLHLAFAQGPHVCIGMHLARLEAFAAVGRLLDRLPGLRLDGETAPRGLVFRKPPELRVRWDQVSP